MKLEKSSPDYIHGTDVREQRRLEDLGAITNRSFLRYLGLTGDESVCDFGCGPGTMEAEIATSYPSIRVVGVERSEEYAAAATRRVAAFSGITIVQADALSSGLASDAFDVTFCRYFLEHVASPAAAAREMVRVTRPGGRIVVQENDLANVVYYPEIPRHAEVMAGFCKLQQQMGGDPFIGRKLFSLFDLKEVETIDLDVEPENYSARRPHEYRAWMSNSLRIMEGARDELVRRGLASEAAVSEVLASMRDRIERPVGVALFHWDRLTARKRALEGVGYGSR